MYARVSIHVLVCRAVCYAVPGVVHLLQCDELHCLPVLLSAVLSLELVELLLRRPAVCIHEHGC
jgi:hypothetical protein